MKLDENEALKERARIRIEIVMNRIALHYNLPGAVKEEVIIKKAIERIADIKRRFVRTADGYEEKT